MIKKLIPLFVSISLCLTACGSSGHTREDYDQLIQKYIELTTEQTAEVESIVEEHVLETVAIEEPTVEAHILEPTEVPQETAEITTETAVEEDTKLVLDDGLPTLIVGSNPEYYFGPDLELYRRRDTEYYDTYPTITLVPTGDFDLVARANEEAARYVNMDEQFKCHGNHPRIDTYLHFTSDQFSETVLNNRNISLSNWNLRGNSVNYDNLEWTRAGLANAVFGTFTSYFPEGASRSWGGSKEADYYGDSAGLPRSCSVMIRTFGDGCQYLLIMPNDNEAYLFDYPLREGVLDGLVVTGEMTVNDMIYTTFNTWIGN